MPEPTSLMCKPTRKCTHAIREVSHEHTYAWVHTVGGSVLAQVSHNPGLFFPPSTVDPLPGQTWKEVTFSKVCLNRDDMWMCWHKHRSRLPTTTSHTPARKAAVVVFFPVLFFSARFLLFPSRKATLCQRKQKHCLF